MGVLSFAPSTYGLYISLKIQRMDIESGDQNYKEDCLHWGLRRHGLLSILYPTLAQWFFPALKYWFPSFLVVPTGCPYSKWYINVCCGTQGILMCRNIASFSGGDWDNHSLLCWLHLRFDNGILDVHLVGPWFHSFSISLLKTLIWKICLMHSSNVKFVVKFDDLSYIRWETCQSGYMDWHWCLKEFQNGDSVFFH